MARALALLVVLAGCSSAAMDAAPMSPGDCPSNASTIVFSIAPATLTRGDAVTIDLLWTADAPLTDPVATLRAGDGPVVEVEVPLALETGSYPYEYLGSLLNPFGAGAPAGLVEVLAAGAVASGCTLVPTAATAFTLE